LQEAKLCQSKDYIIQLECVIRDVN